MNPTAISGPDPRLIEFVRAIARADARRDRSEPL